jgi:Protein of unknown function (DUF3102)
MHGNTLPTQAGQVTSTLAEHVAEIRRLYKRVTSDIIEIGRRLTDCQGIVGHGHWHDWLKAEFGWSDSSALNFMRVYDMSKSANFTDLGIPFSALYLLAAPYTPEKTRTEIIERAKAGESVSVADVKDAIADAKGRKQPARKKAKLAVSATTMPVETVITSDQADEPTAIDTTEPTVSTTMAPAAGDLTVEELAAALEKVGAKKLIAALELVPEVNAAVVKHVLRQHKRPLINKEMTNALRAGVGTNEPAANQLAISKIKMKIDRLGLDRNDVSIVIRKPLSDAPRESESDESAPYRQGASRLIPAGNGVDADTSADQMKAAHASAERPQHQIPDDLSVPEFLRRGT